LSAVPSSAFFSSSVWAGEPLGHLVEGQAELSDLVPRAHGRARREVAPAHPPGRPGQRGDRAHHDVAHGESEERAGHRDGQDGDEDLLIALALDLRENRDHGGRHPHHGAHRVIGAVTTLTALLVRHGVEQGEEGHPVPGLQRLLDLLRRDGAREEGPPGRGGRGPLHLLDVGQDPGENRVLLDLLDGGEVVKASTPLRR
jgi:hypothetical protein